MKTLEPKHLVSYLPHELKGFVNNEKVILIGLDIISEYWILWKKLAASNEGCSVSKGFKPILHPLSDLTEHAANVWGIYSLKHLLRLIEKKEVPLHIYLELLEKHYDVFGLIKQGLAISYNDLEN